MNTRLLIIFCILNILPKLLWCQAPEQKKQEIIFKTETAFFFKKNIKPTKGTTDLTINASFGYSFSVGYRFNFKIGTFVESNIDYSRNWVSYTLNYNSNLLNSGNLNSIDYLKTNINHKIERESIRFGIFTGQKSKISKNNYAHLKVGLMFQYNTFPFQENRNYSYVITNTGGASILQNNIETSVNFPGGNFQQFNSKISLKPLINIDGGISLNFKKITKKTFIFSVGLSCSCLSDEGVGTINVKYFDINKNLIGETFYKNRWLSINFGLGINF